MIWTIWAKCLVRSPAPAHPARSANRSNALLVPAGLVAAVNPRCPALTRAACR